MGETRKRNIKNAPADKSATGTVKAELLVDQPDRWRGYWTRFYTSLLMIFGFGFILWLGHIAAVIFVIVLQTIVFKEILKLSILINQKKTELPTLSKNLNWWFFVAVNYFLIGRIIFGRFSEFFRSAGDSLFPLIHYHTFISFWLYMTGVIFFVLSLQKDKYKAQFKQFAWTHMALFATVLSSSFWIQNIFEGLFWLLLPTFLIITNDVWAYIFGFFFGRTPLIQLSPRKTWEGFIGGMLMTFAVSFVLSYLLAMSNLMICPRIELDVAPVTCIPHPIYVLRSYLLPDYLAKLLGQESVMLYPVQLHALVMGMFASLIGPYGGFFASGLKRAFNIKDFGDSIPGHGGLTDRMDCQFLMGVFSHIYYISFIANYASAAIVLQNIYALSTEDQMEVYKELTSYLQNRSAFP